MYDFSFFKKRGAGVREWLTKEYSSIRTGRATPTILDNVSIDLYGTQTPIKHVAAISVEDARTIRISPWDKSHIKLIESALVASNLGLGSAPDGESIRVIFPILTTERRAQLLKLAGEKLEEARVSLRSAREEVQNDLTAKEKANAISEDDKFRAKAELQKLVDGINAELDNLMHKKESEIKE